MRLYFLPLFITLFMLLASYPFSQKAISESSMEVDEILKVGKDIQLLNLINGLDLNQEQMQLIIQKAKEAAEIRKKFIKRRTEKQIEMFSILQELRENLLRDKTVSPDLKTKVRRNIRIILRLKDDYEKRTLDLVASLKKKLYDYQLYSLDQYVPCLIPPDGPSRIGQESNSMGIEKMLIKIRNMPEPIFEKKKRKLVQFSIKLIRRDLPKGFMIDEESERKRILSIFKDARTLSDIDFALEKTKLAQSLKSEYKLPELPIDISVKIEKFLLSYQIIPLLQERLSKR